MSPPVILWFRQDLRLTDNPALQAAADTGQPVIPVYILDEESPDVRRHGGASRWWLHHSLRSLAASLEERGATLVLHRGPAADVIARLQRDTGATRVFWNRLYEPALIERDRGIKAALGDSGVEAQSYNGSLIREPWEIQTKTGKPYGVFTPFWKALLEQGVSGSALPAPARIPGPANPIASDALEDWELLPTKPDWAGGLRKTWRPGEAAARQLLGNFHEEGLTDYASMRDIPGRPGTSRLSPYLHFGEISPRQVWQATSSWAQASGGAAEKAANAYLREIGWREFNNHLLFHYPDLPDRNVNGAFDAFPWQPDETHLRAWQKGRTGYPLVDAGMRELWETGWMHNRVRMVVASFLVKHLLIDWREGERWFWDTLVDADLANNSGNWQWVAGCGFDAAPYFRIFNPTLQAEKFDPDGAYVRRWVPEIADLPDKHLHKPWEAPGSVLEAAGVRLGQTYPAPIVDHKAARQRALDAFASVKKGSA